VGTRGIIESLERRDLVVDDLPYYFHVHLNEPCNQRCIMCIPDGQHGKGELPFEEFVALFDRIKAYARHITLIGGEPLMYSRIVDVLNLLAEHPIGVTINTNATLLDERVVPSLLRLHRLELKCSIDAVSSDMYHRIRGRKQFRRVTGHLLDFAERSRDLPNIEIIPVYVVMRENIGEVVPFLDFAELLEPSRVEFHPVRHVASWSVENGTGWHFEGREQVCESFTDEFNEVMRAAEAVADRKGIEIEVHYL
jgi:MoaA/NifB/PqqE/SkfB family radical SAM enzyme